MKSIQLTEEHKSKLLEMCKVLFPEYVIYPADNDGFIEGEQWVGDQNMGEDRPVNEFNIHWFEFCMTHLFEKIMVILYNYESINDFIQINGYFICGHPVDYLYKEFKKFKQHVKYN